MLTRLRERILGRLPEEVTEDCTCHHCKHIINKDFNQTLQECRQVIEEELDGASVDGERILKILNTISFHSLPNIATAISDEKDVIRLKEEG